jgi:glycosyl transferase family 2
MSTSDTPLVTVVMPATKTRFLAAAIESALGQDYPRLEVIVLDDGSPDPAMVPLLEGIAEREPERFRFVSHDNVGQSETINRGLALARGEIAGYLSDDDLLLPGAVSRLAAALVAAPQAVVAYPGYEIIDEAGKTIDTITPTGYSVAESVRLHDAIVGAGAFFRVDAFRRIGGWDRDLRYRADYDFWLRLGMEGRFVRIADALAAWRYHPAAGTVADAGLRMSNESLRVLDKLYAEADLPADLEAVRGQAYRNAFIQAAMVLTLGGNDPGERFFVHDRHMPKISRTAAEAGGGADVLLSAQVAQLDREVAGLRAELAQREEQVAYLGRPWWWRAGRRLAPAGMRPRLKRLAARLRPGSAGGPGA